MAIPVTRSISGTNHDGSDPADSGSRVCVCLRGRVVYTRRAENAAQSQAWATHNPQTKEANVNTKALGKRVARWKRREIDVACVALNFAQTQGGPEANPESLEFFTEGFLRTALTKIRPRFNPDGRRIIAEIEARLRSGR